MLSVILVFTMLCNTAVFAEEVPNRNDYIVIAAQEAVFDDGITFVSELSVLPTRARIGFSGSHSALITHRYLAANGDTLLEIDALAVFSSTLGQNECHFDEAMYYEVYNNTASFTYATAFGETKETNKGSGDFGIPRYARYEVNYRVVSSASHIRGYKKMWIKCTANLDITNSGDKETQLTSAVYYNNMYYTFA